MQSIKQRFPDEVSLRSFLASHARSYTDQVQGELGMQEAKYRQALRNRKIGSTLLVGGILAGISAAQLYVEAGLISGWFLLGVLVLAGVSIWKGWQMTKGVTAIINEFNAQLNDVIYNAVFSLFGLTGGRVEHTFDESESEGLRKLSRAQRLTLTSNKFLQSQTIEYAQVKELLDHSELITEDRNRMMVDDMFTVTVYNRTLFASELDVKNITGSGKHRRVKKIFSGYFVSYDLPKELSGKTFVTTEGDTNGFADQSHLSFFTKPDAAVTELEWNAFEDKLHVVTDNPSEARYILTPDFMQDLYDWCVEKHQKIRLSFVASRMYALFPDNTIRFNKTITKITEEEVRTYMESIALPFLHVLHLIEDVEGRFWS